MFLNQFLQMLAVKSVVNNLCEACLDFRTVTVANGFDEEFPGLHNSEVFWHVKPTDALVSRRGMNHSLIIS